MKNEMSRRDVLGVAAAILSPAMAAEAAPLKAPAGVDRVTVLTGKTHLRGWAGYGDPPRARRMGHDAQANVCGRYDISHVAEAYQHEYLVALGGHN